jgi:hypothetical protein
MPFELLAQLMLDNLPRDPDRKRIDENDILRHLPLRHTPFEGSEYFCNAAIRWCSRRVTMP